MVTSRYYRRVLFCYNYLLQGCKGERTLRDNNINRKKTGFGLGASSTKGRKATSTKSTKVIKTSHKKTNTQNKKTSQVLHSASTQTQREGQTSKVFVWLVGTICGFILGDAYDFGKEYFFDSKPKTTTNTSNTGTTPAGDENSSETRKRRIIELIKFATKDYDSTIFKVIPFYTPSHIKKLNKDYPDEFILAINNRSVIYKFYFKEINGKLSKEVEIVHNPHTSADRVEIIQKNNYSLSVPKDHKKADIVYSRDYQLKILNMEKRHLLKNKFEILDM